MATLLRFFHPESVRIEGYCKCHHTMAGFNSFSWAMNSSLWRGDISIGLELLSTDRSVNRRDTLSDDNAGPVRNPLAGVALFILAIGILCARKKWYTIRVLPSITYRVPDIATTNRIIADMRGRDITQFEPMAHTIIMVMVNNSIHHIDQSIFERYTFRII